MGDEKPNLNEPVMSAEESGNYVEDGCIYRNHKKMQGCLENMFTKYGTFVTRLPWVLILFGILLAVACSFGFFYGDWDDELRRVWIPRDSPADRNWDDVEDKFGDPVTRYTVYVVAENDNNPDLLNSEAMKGIVDFDKAFKAVEKSGLTYDTMCERLEDANRCQMYSSVLNFWENNDRTYTVDATTPYQVRVRINTGHGISEELYPSYDPYYIPVTRTFSGRLPKALDTTDAGANDIYYAEAIQWDYLVQVEDSKADDLEDWEDELEDAVDDFNDAQNLIEVHVYYTGSVRRDLIQALRTDIGLYGGALAFIFIYGLFVLGRCHPVYCRASLTLAMVFVWIITIIMSAAFIGYMGLKYTSSNAFISYMSAVIIILQTTFLTRSINSVRLSASEARGEVEYNYSSKFAEGFGYAMSSIFKTWLIVVIAFVITAFSSIIAIQSFCVVGALLATFMLLETMLILGPAIYYDTKRILSNKGDCFTACSCDPESSACCCGKCLVDEHAQKKMAMTDVFIIGKMLPFMLNNWVRLLFIMFYIGISVVGIIGIVNVEQEFEVDWLVKTDSGSLADARDVRNDYFGDRGSIVNMYTYDNDFSNEGNQADLAKFIAKFKSCNNCDKSWLYEDTVFAWYESYIEWMKLGLCLNVADSPVSLTNNNVVPAEYFDSCLLKWIALPEAQLFINDLVFKDGKLDAARFYGRVEYTKQQEDGVKINKDMTNIADDYGPGDSFPYNEDFLFYELYQVFELEIYKFTGCLVAATFVVTLVFAVYPMAAILVTLNVICIILATFATMWALSVELNIVTIFHVFMAGIIGLEFSSHITHVFVSQEGKRRQRFVSTFKYIGGSLPHVMVALLLSIVIFFSPTTTYIFHMFGFCWGGIAFFTFTHCFFVLPILLTLVGPRSAEVEQMGSDVKMLDAHDPMMKVGAEVGFQKAMVSQVEIPDISDSGASGSGSWAAKVVPEGNTPGQKEEEWKEESLDDN